MKVFLSFPSPSKLEFFLKEKHKAVFNYSELNGTKSKHVSGYDNDLNSIFIGSGEEVWEKAKLAMQAWQQFPPGWTKIYKDSTLIKSENTVLVLFKLFGIWWLNSAKIVYTFEEERRFGFAYGTLEGHVEKGEECFWIDRDEKNNIYYHIKAFSKPDFWGAKLIYPIARNYQRKFVRDSMQRMKDLVSDKK